MQSGWPIAGWSAVLSQLSHLSVITEKLSHLSTLATLNGKGTMQYRVRRTTYIQLSPTGGQLFQWTFLYHNMAHMLPPPYSYTSMFTTTFVRLALDRPKATGQLLPRNPVWHFSLRTLTSPGSTHRCESGVRWILRTEPLKSWASPWTLTSPLAFMPWLYRASVEDH